MPFPVRWTHKINGATKLKLPWSCGDREVRMDMRGRKKGQATCWMLFGIPITISFPRCCVSSWPPRFGGQIMIDCEPPVFPLAFASLAGPVCEQKVFARSQSENSSGMSIAAEESALHLAAFGSWSEALEQDGGRKPTGPRGAGMAATRTGAAHNLEIARGQCHPYRGPLLF